MKRKNKIRSTINDLDNVCNKASKIYLPLSPLCLNIQLLYDSNTSIELELWDENFYPISLHKSFKYLAFDTKNIKDFLNFVAKYISNKQIDPKRSNDI